jgi:hypothetical protein
MADFTGHFRGVPKSVPMHSLQSLVIELWNLLLIRGLSGRRRFFENTPSKSAFTKRILGIRKYLRSVYLQTRGEVAEWLKAAVC